MDTFYSCTVNRNSITFSDPQEQPVSYGHPAFQDNAHKSRGLITLYRTPYITQFSESQNLQYDSPTAGILRQRSTLRSEVPSPVAPLHLKHGRETTSILYASDLRGLLRVQHYLRIVQGTCSVHNRFEYEWSVNVSCNWSDSVEMFIIRCDF
ncbi:unnamed protein product [Nezara viridula]|uniref:Uncharacterized protein n=1 Tax=Nezara viridula TaxID=85310 RepID=A0A9P0H2M8_NEZVI|nr:unnamed protein product [Nezara viridula]